MPLPRACLGAPADDLGVGAESRDWNRRHHPHVVDDATRGEPGEDPVRRALQHRPGAAQQAAPLRYHHASRNAAEGFCIYNDVGIAVQGLRGRGLLGADERVLIVDVDAHHGNGNAHVFLKDPSVEILDTYNGDIYPNSPATKRRVDIDLPVPSGTRGDDYLSRLDGGLQRLTSGARLAFVIAGTDVLATDPLGALGLSVQECAERDRLVLARLKQLAIPAVFLAGGGYGRESADAMIAGVTACRSVA